MIGRISLAALTVLALVSTVRQEEMVKFLPPAGEHIVVDMTYDFAEGETLYWPTSTPFNLTNVHQGVVPETGVYYELNDFCASEHGGTHVDAPSHFARDVWNITSIPIDGIIGETIVIDVSDKTADDSDYQATVADLTEWESKHKRIPDGALMFLYTAWGRHWPDAVKYLGTDTKNVSLLHFPGLHPESARWLVDNRKIKALGIDTASIDYGQSKRFETHTILFTENIPALENLANMDKLPPTGTTVIGLPMKIRGGSGAPLRIIALLPSTPGNKAATVVLRSATRGLVQLVLVGLIILNIL